MYKSLTVYLHQNNFYEDLAVELFEIEQKKKEIFRKVNTVTEIKYMDSSEKENLINLINREMMILHDLLNANASAAEEMGIMPDHFTDDDEY